MRMRQSRVIKYSLFGVKTGGIQKIITDEARRLGIRSLPKAFKLDLIKHISDVVIITIRSEILNLIEWRNQNRINILEKEK